MLGIRGFLLDWLVEMVESHSWGTHSLLDVLPHSLTLFCVVGLLSLLDTGTEVHLFLLAVYKGQSLL